MPDTYEAPTVVPTLDDNPSDIQAQRERIEGDIGAIRLQLDNTELTEPKKQYLEELIAKYKSQISRLSA